MSSLWKLATAAVTLIVFVFSVGSHSTMVADRVVTASSTSAFVTTAAPVTTVAPTTTTAVTTTTTTTTSTSTPSPPTTASVVLQSLETPQLTDIEKIVCDAKYLWPCGEALAVAWCESWHRPGAVSEPNRDGTIDRGLFQVNEVWEDAFPLRWRHILDPVVNTDMAHHIWLVGGRSWLYWTCQP